MPDGKYITQLPESAEITDSTLFITDNGIETKQSTAEVVKIYISNGILPEALKQAQNWAHVTFSKPNLLINGDFQVWQRGTSFSKSVNYLADRWRSLNASYNTFEKVDNGVHIVNNTNDYSYFQQKLGFKLDQDVVISCSINGVIYKSKSADPRITVILGEGEVFLYKGEDSFSFRVKVGTDCIINWIKLEYGKEPTAFIPRSYDEELYKCYRYYVRYENTLFPFNQILTGLTAGTLTMFCCLPVDMRTKTPTIKGTYTFDIRGEGTTISVSQDKFSTIEYAGVGMYKLGFTGLSTTSFTANSYKYVVMTKSGIIEFDNEIY